MKQKFTGLKREVYHSVIIGDFNNPLSVIDRTVQKNSKDLLDFNQTISQLGLINIDGMLHPTRAENTFFSGAYGTFFRIDNMPDLENKFL